MSKNRVLTPALLTVLFLLLSTVSPVFAANPCAGYLLIRPDLSDKRGLSCFFTS